MGNFDPFLVLSINNNSSHTNTVSYMYTLLLAVIILVIVVLCAFYNIIIMNTKVDNSFLYILYFK